MVRLCKAILNLSAQFISCGITHSSLFLLPGIPVYIPCTGTIPTKTVVSVVVGVRVLQKCFLMKGLLNSSIKLYLELLRRQFLLCQYRQYKWS